MRDECWMVWYRNHFRTEFPGEWADEQIQTALTEILNGGRS